MSDYTAGGYIPGGPTPYLLDADECLIRMTQVPGLWCSRGDHPTETSDCTKHVHGIHHESEKPA